LRRRFAGLAIAVLLAGACTKPVVVSGPSEADDYVKPSWPAGELRPAEARDFERAWLEIQSGQTRPAESRLSKVLRRQPGLLAAETALAYARLRAGRLDEAQKGFASVLQRRPEDVSALVGAAAVASRKGESEAALAALQAAARVPPENAVVRRRLSEVRLQVTERRVAAAREAEQSGSLDKAIEAYQAALAVAPELAGARLELANLLVTQGRAPEAAALLEADPQGDRTVLMRLGEILVELTEHNRALEAYRRVLARDPRDEEAQQKSRAVRESLEMLQMPQEYRRISGAETINRADLAALVIVKATALSRVPSGPAKVAIDISGSWARDHIIRALALDIVDVYPNHTFQPLAVVRRGDLARAVQRVLDLLKHPAVPGPAPTDLSSNNLFHYPASRVVAAGLMDLTPGGAFESWRPVTGQEAIDVLEGLVRLVGP
jgi:tetratricopeptide (TPR) repeat protein